MFKTQVEPRAVRRVVSLLSQTTEQYFLVVLFILLYRVDLIFNSVDLNHTV